MAEAQECLSVFGEFFILLMLLSLKFQWNHLENIKITNTYAYFFTLRIAVSLVRASNAFL